MAILQTVVGLLLVSTLTAHAQSAVSNLNQEIATGRIELVAATGTGSSTGGAVHGTLVNTTARSRRIAVQLPEPLYFLNENPSGQNMIATAVYMRDGGYVTDGRYQFVELRPNHRIEVLFVGYCADFSKDNPALTDAFQIAPGPPDVVAVGRKIAAFQAEDPDRDILTAAQVALWLSQGHSLESIREQFDFTPQDVVTARRILR